MSLIGNQTQQKKKKIISELEYISVANIQTKGWAGGSEKQQKRDKEHTTYNEKVQYTFRIEVQAERREED